MIEHLTWDSDFFKYNVGKVIFSEVNFNLLEFKKKSLNYKLVYLISEHPVRHFSELFQEQKLTYLKRVVSNPFQSYSSVFKLDLISNHSYNLENLIYLSGENSRFNLDPNFVNNEFRRMYLHWFQQAYDERLGKKVIVKVLNDEPIGLVFFSIKSQVLNIELISVSTTFQGKGIARELLNEIESEARKNGCSFIQVVTQGINQKAIALYDRFGFQLEEKKYIYHYWNL
jgi:dTDP-4-amino-4,6-dideoxy-D-galactose acyltransferase